MAEARRRFERSLALHGRLLPPEQRDVTQAPLSLAIVAEAQGRL